MGYKIEADGVFNIKSSYKRVIDEKYNTKVAIWQLPYNSKYKEYDLDGSKWFESLNKSYDNEIEEAEKNLNMSFNRYKVLTKTITYDDNTTDEIFKYPNGNVVKTSKGLRHVFVTIKNKLGQKVAEKTFNNQSNEGHKYIYKNAIQDGSEFVVTKVYKYDTSKNKASDAVNYGYTSQDKNFINGCEFVKEFYSLNGKQVKAEKISDSEYRVTDENNKILTFKVE